MLAMKLRLDDLLNFPFGFTIDNVRHELFIIGAVGLSFTILCEEVNMEDQMDLHGCREGQMVCDGRQLLGDKEGTIMLGC